MPRSGTAANLSGQLPRLRHTVRLPRVWGRLARGVHVRVPHLDLAYGWVLNDHAPRGLVDEEVACDHLRGQTGQRVRKRLGGGNGEAREDGKARAKRAAGCKRVVELVVSGPV